MSWRRVRGGLGEIDRGTWHYTGGPLGLETCDTRDVDVYSQLLCRRVG